MHRRHLKDATNYRLAYMLQEYSLTSAPDQHQTQIQSGGLSDSRAASGLIFNDHQGHPSSMR